ncbi:hypothetical protein ACET3Z_030960 [Daucus carota]
MASFKLQNCFVLLLALFLLTVPVLCDEKDNLLQGINSYRKLKGLPDLTKNDKAGCLADEIADKLENEPCARITGSNSTPPTTPQFSNYPEALKKCKVDDAYTKDGKILPVCVKNRIPTLVLTNYTQSSYATNMVDEAAESLGKLVVQTVSEENILPSSPTPDHLRIFKLSVLDQIIFNFYIPLTLFYLNHNTSELSSVISNRSKILKHTLSKTLSRFYPLAGKIKDTYHIECNDEGVYYIQTQVNTHLTDFLGQSPGPGNEILNLLVPHKAKESVTGSTEVESNEFYIRTAPTRFEVVAALLWKCYAKAAYKLSNNSLEKPFVLGMVINLRGKNCIPKNAVGNLVWTGLAECKLVTDLGDNYLISQIQKGKTEINDDFFEVIKGDTGLATILHYTEMIMKSQEVCFPLLITSMCNMGVYEHDFGEGKPIWLYYGNVNLVHFISLCETRVGGGLEAVVSLKKEEMAIFENDPELLAFTTLNPAPL